MKQETLNSIFAAIGTGLTYIFGGWDTVLLVLVIFMGLDYLTGVIAATYQKNLNSEIGFKGLLKKCTILIVLIVAVMLDKLINQGTWVFRTLVAYFYIANEAISLLENSSKVGLPIPEKLVNALAQLKDKGDE
ncbi:holin, Cph1 family [Clostridium sp. USBA 49]|uniref:phage holin family protein n=1 Tax=Clostridium sp. USBA 49 TaxID=1881060 RepID=UPI00099A3FED|nr:phage holin family protein [Clostridium sp. USBA 49]SKA89768.1 holin, Cph1 family [Clostridium sp. USBA 49]